MVIVDELDVFGDDVKVFCEYKVLFNLVVELIKEY